MSVKKPDVVVAIIPARLAATRLPNKPLLDICGKPMIQHVWERCRATSILSQVYVATPDMEIARVVEGFGGKVIMTSAHHRTGTDRLAEAIMNIAADIIVNVQGDEPLIQSDTIEGLAKCLVANPSIPMSTVMCPCPMEELDSPSTVKVVVNVNGDALYFSRSRIPFDRNDSAPKVMQHIGLYGYRRDFLLKYVDMPVTPLEQAESLEQLRALESGHRIRMVFTNIAPLSVDTIADLDRVRSIIRLRVEQ